MTDQNSSTSTTSQTGNDSTSTETEAKTPRKINNVEGLKSRTFRIPSHCETILQIMNKQRQTGEFCDITVLVEHQRFSAHKSVLAANSIYFKNLLATGNDGIFLHHVTAESFAAILDFMYTSRLHLEPYSVQDILSASKFLQVKGVISICCRYLESQIRVYARDGDENKINSTKPAVLTVDPEFLKGGILPSLSPIQQQPQLAYNPNTGLFVTAAPGVQGLKPVIVGTDQHQPRTMMLPYQGQRQHPGVFNPTTSQIHNSQPNFSNNMAHPFAVKSRNINPTYPLNPTKTTYAFQAPLLQPSRPSVVLPHVSYPEQTNGMIAPNYKNSVRHPNYPMPYSAYDQKGNLLAEGPKQFSYDPFMNPAQQNFNHVAAPMYASKSTGGKGRRQHLPARRKGGYGSVSAGSPSIKFTFEGIKKFPSTSTTSQNKTINDNSTSSEQILMLSSARESKSCSNKDKQPNTPDTVFDVEAEDRYWDALSNRAQNQNNNN